MKLFDSHNPILKVTRFNAAIETGNDTLSMSGAMRKTGLMFFILLLGISWTWSSGGYESAAGLDWRLLAGIAGGLVCSIIASFAPYTARFTGSIYVFCQGMVLGSVSSMLEYSYPGIAIQAFSITLAVFATMWFVYTFPVIKVTGKLRVFLFASITGILLIYLAGFVLELLGIRAFFLHESGIVGVGISLFITGIASLSLLLDFDFIKRMSEQHAPAELEWYAAFGLMVTLIWLYVEILRLLSKIKK